MTLAKKMDRLEGSSKARMRFIRNLHSNNEAKRFAITCSTEERLKQEFENGIIRATKIFDDIRQEHIAMKSIPRRLTIIQQHCVFLELQANQGRLWTTSVWFRSRIRVQEAVLTVTWCSWTTSWRIFTLMRKYNRVEQILRGRKRERSREKSAETS